ncbi:unnamed protein product [Spirodela intermedia]|uniref:J domain-containing protein n=1 Tax=Spirodela intermedia TaxID=51605 RepID=A0ABN7E8B3_SPIIN|nr:unnamed protein product [Spirodela intermedia]
MNAASSLSSSTSSSLTCGRIFRRSRGGAPVRKIGSHQLRVSFLRVGHGEGARGFRRQSVFTIPRDTCPAVALRLQRRDLCMSCSACRAGHGDEIKAAYRRLARACHPDVVAADRKGASADEFMKIHAAYTTLSTPTSAPSTDRRMVSPRAAAFAVLPSLLRPSSSSVSSRSLLPSDSRRDLGRQTSAGRSNRIRRR